MHDPHSPESDELDQALQRVIAARRQQGVLAHNLRTEALAGNENSVRDTLHLLEEAIEECVEAHRLWCEVSGSNWDFG